MEEQTYRYPAAGVLSAVNAYDPDSIVLGGSLVLVWPDSCGEEPTHLKGRSLGFASSGIRITPASFGSDAAALGAAVLAVPRSWPSSTLSGCRPR